MIAVAMVAAIPSFAVTDKEMEQARTMAAKHYLRYANNGSDYLDNLTPTSVAELSKSLKAKEQENIKSFNAVAVPKDYASWDKKKLVEYWSSTFFKSAGLKEDGKKCLGILARNLDKINVGAPQSKPAETATAVPAEATAAPSQPTEAEAPASATPADAATAEQPAADAADLTAQADADAGLIDEQPRQKSNTGWYVGILVVLVAVVIWLVMYASKSMKESGAAGEEDRRSAEKEIRETQLAAKEEKNKMREQYASSLNSKNGEIKQLKAECDALATQLDNAKAENDTLKRELDATRRELERAKTQAQAPRPPKAGGQNAGQAPQPPKGGGLPPVVYLGYVNQKGLFVKASRSLNAESSVYRMDIPDGHHGTYSVVNDPSVLDRVLDNPAQWLAGGCVIENPEDADIATEIITLQPGEALFAENTCRVTKKAHIKYI